MLRGKVGDEVILLDGKGTEAFAICVEGSRKSSRFMIQDLKRHAMVAQLELLGPLPKGRRFAYLCEKIQELGVCRYTPLSTEFSVREETGLSGRQKALDRFREACKQSRNPWLTELGEPLSLAEVAWGEDCMVLDVGGQSLWQQPLSAPHPKKLFFGPEAGWSSKERELFKDKGICSLSVGGHHLRMETAAVVGAGMVLDWMSCRFRHVSK